MLPALGKSGVVMSSKVIVGLCLASVLAVGVYAMSPRTAPSAPAAPPVDYATQVGAAADLNEQWEKTFDKTGKFPDKQDPEWHYKMYGVLLRVPEDSPSYRDARLLVDKFAVRQLKINEIEKKVKVDRIATDADGRARFVDNLDTLSLKAGKDANYKVSGPKNTVLTMTYVMINRPFVYNLVNENRFLERAWEAGFKRVVFRNGFGGGADSWTYDAPKVTQ